MKLKNGSLEIPEDDIFQNDKLKRRHAVENLAVLLVNVSSPLVLSVNAPWGAGKTTFLKMLNAKLNSSAAKSIYFSAWETDFALDPLVAFLGEMNTGLSKHIGSDLEKTKAWATAKAAGLHILRRGIPVGVKVATAGLLDFEKVIEDEASKLSEALTKDVIDNYSKDKAAIGVFKSNVAKVLKSSDGGREKLFIFVDELDRCRPTYAIELLERIKHLLDVEGLVFVLALDKTQLAHSVRAVYGADFDAAGYLKRFIDVEFALPSANPSTFIDHLLSSLELDSYFASRNRRETVHDRDTLVGMLNELAKKMSLRAIEQLLSRVKLVSLTVNEQQYFYPEIVLFMLLVKESYPDVYSEFSAQGSSGTKISSLINAILPGDELSLARQYVEGLIIAGKFADARGWADSRVKELQTLYNSADTSEVTKSEIARTLEVVEYSGRSTRGISLKNILERIDMLSAFQFEE